MNKILLLTVFSFILLSCEKEDSFNADYNFLYGDWIPKQVDAGMSYNTDPTKLGDLIQIIEKSSYKVIKSNEVVDEGSIDILSQSIDELTLEFKSKKIDPDYSASQIRISRHTLKLHKITNDSISLANSATDGGFFGVILSRN